MDKFKEARVAGEAAKFATEMTAKIEAERDMELKTIIEMAKKSPLIIKIKDPAEQIKAVDYILYLKDGKLELAAPDKMEPAFKNLEELGEYIALSEETK